MSPEPSRGPWQGGPTRRQLEVLRAYIRTGSAAGAAHALRISETTVRQHLSGLYRRIGCVNAAQAAYLLGKAEAPRSDPIGRLTASEEGRS
jgi:DNA-binding NarL/FixJ family response regulator